MKFLAAYLLSTLSGNESPSAADVKKILSSVGAEVDTARLDTLLASLNGKNVNEVRSVRGNVVIQSDPLRASSFDASQ